MSTICDLNARHSLRKSAFDTVACKMNKGEYKNNCEGQSAHRFSPQGDVWTTSESALDGVVQSRKNKGINELGRSISTWDHKVDMRTRNSLHH